MSFEEFPALDTRRYVPEKRCIDCMDLFQHFKTPNKKTRRKRSEPSIWGSTTSTAAFKENNRNESITPQHKRTHFQTKHNTEIFPIETVMATVRGDVAPYWI